MHANFRNSQNKPQSDILISKRQILDSRIMTVVFKVNIRKFGGLFYYSVSSNRHSRFL